MTNSTEDKEFLMKRLSVGVEKGREEKKAQRVRVQNKKKNRRRQKDRKRAKI